VNRLERQARVAERRGAFCGIKPPLRRLIRIAHDAQQEFQRRQAAVGNRGVGDRPVSHGDRARLSARTSSAPAVATRHLKNRSLSL
jgi:hypothetical protein